MKFIGNLFFAGLICAAASANLPKANSNGFSTINQHFIDFFHNERVNFPCGWPDSGIPPLEPYLIEEFDMELDTSELSGGRFILRNALVTGQRHMWMNDFDMRIAGLIMTFDISIPILTIDGEHTTTGNLGLVPISGSGRCNMVVNNVRVIGTGQLRTLAGGFLNLDRLVSTVRVGAVDATLNGFGIILDATISRIISAAAPSMVNSNQDRISEGVNEFLMPGMNRFLNQHTMTTLINVMADRNQNPPPRRCFL